MIMSMMIIREVEVPGNMITMALSMMLAMSMMMIRVMVMSMITINNCFAKLTTSR